MNQWKSLIFKDIRLHGLAFVTSWAGISAIVLLATWYKPPDSPEQKRALFLAFHMLLNVVYGQWLVDQEKTKGTFILLRTFPISDTMIVSSKFVTYSMLQVFGVLLTAIFVLPEQLLDGSILSILAGVCLLVAFGCLSMAGRWIIGPRLGQAAAAALAFVLVVLLIKVRPLVSPGVRSLLESRLVLVLVCILTIVLVWYTVIRWFQRRDTQDWVE